VDSTPGHEIVLEFTPPDRETTLRKRPLLRAGTGVVELQRKRRGLSVHVGKGITSTYNVSGDEAFTDRGRGEVDLFAALETLKTALENGDRDLVNEQVNQLTAARTTSGSRSQASGPG